MPMTADDEPVLVPPATYVPSVYSHNCWVVAIVFESNDMLSKQATICTCLVTPPYATVQHLCRHPAQRFQHVSQHT